MTVIKVSASFLKPLRADPHYFHKIARSMKSIPDCTRLYAAPDEGMYND